MKKNIINNIVTEETDINKYTLLPLFKSEQFSDTENNLITRLIVSSLIEQDWIKQRVTISIIEPIFKEGSNESFLGTIYKISQSQNASLKLVQMKETYDNEDIYFVKSYPIYSYLNGKFVSHKLKLVDNIKLHEITLEFRNLIPLYEG